MAKPKALDLYMKQVDEREAARKDAANNDPEETLRDRFAMAALNQRKMLSTGAWYAADAAREAYEIADAMILARKQ